MSEPTRPTCGTCPHKVEIAVRSLLGPRVVENIFHICAHHPPHPEVDGRPHVDAGTPGCIHHPDMSEYVEAWKLARGKPQ